MGHPLLVAVLLVVAALFTAVSLLTRGKRPQSIPEYFVASRSLKRPMVISLLVSGSFSLNGMLYQIYLGYKIGWWALLPQAFWACSFLLLGKYGGRISASAGLHSFLGSTFSPSTRTLAAICSVVGLSLQIGWEYSVAKSAFSGLTAPPLSTVANYFVVGAIFAAATFYTMVGGLRSNSVTDMVQNCLKIGCFVILGLLAYGGISANHGPPHWEVSSASAMITELTISGLVANLVFSLAWQFGDMSTWQTAIASRDDGAGGDAASALRWAGLWVFIAPGILGTVVGIVLSGQSGLDSNSVLPALLGTISSNPAFVVLLAVALVAAVMSFIDGVVLAIGYTVVTDLVFRGTVDRHRLLLEPTLEEAASPGYQRALATVMSASRLALIAAAIAGTVLLDVLSRYGVSLFDQVYVVTVAQLALVGAVIQGLRGYRAKPGAGVQSIVAGLALGFGLVTAGVLLSSADIGNLAPVGAVAGSWFVALLRTARERAAPDVRSDAGASP